ncbi:retrotransposon hot spot (RHS) protein [Trypanosoma cruzi]|nr:retrotransposon hot spot (RHS) protein [Trypanosoma cruzi]
MKFTISTSIEDVLFKGGFRVKEMRLNDFLTVIFGGRSILRANRSVLLRDFFSDPTRYIHDAGVLNEIQATGAYARMEEAVRDEIIFEEDRSKLRDKGVINLLGWSEAAANVKTTVHNNNKNSLDAALEEARNPTTTSTPIYLEGCYESVYNAKWHHLVEVPGGEGTGMDVEEGEPPQS